MLCCKVKLCYKQYYIVLGYTCTVFVHTGQHIVVYVPLCDDGVEGGQEGREVFTSTRVSH